MRIYSKLLDVWLVCTLPKGFIRRATTTVGLSTILLIAPIFGSLPVYAAPTNTIYPLPSRGGSPFQITKGPNGALWFTEPQSRKVGTITSDGTITEYPTGDNYQPRDIVAGSDGALWFTSSPSTSLYRITTSGAVTTFNAQSYPYAVTAGSDGALWFTTQSYNNDWEIGRMTTSGNVTIYPVAGNLSSFLSIASGPDGSLWFSEEGNDPGGNAIGRMTTTGVYSRYPTPTANAFPYGITAGPDGAVWFTETNAANIGRIDSAGSIIEYPIPSGEHAGSGIATGPDGAIWYSSGGSYSVGRMTTSGIGTQYAVPASTGGLTGVSGGFDGAVWYDVSSPGASAIGRITTPTPIALQSINAGGGASGSFAADSGFSGGAAYTTTAPVDTSETATPAPQAVYQSARYGNNFSYAFSGLTPGAAYTLRLHFNELYWGAGSNGGGIGSRVFNVGVNGQSALSNYDIYNQAGGANKAITEQLPAIADASGNLTVQFTTVTDNAMVNGAELFDGTLPPQPPRPPHTAATVINAGGNVAGSFAADTEYTGGSTYTSTAAVDTGAVSSPAPQAVYQSVRYGNFTYTIPQLTPNANYHVRLHFNELYWGAGSNSGGVGSRVFNVGINGTSVLSNYDIYAAAGGANKAIVQDFVVPANAQGTLTIQFTSLVDNAMVNGIEVNPA